MAFFRSEPNLPDTDKARVEFHLQQIAECIGFDRFKLPVLCMKSLLGLYESKLTPDQMIGFVGEHLYHDINGLRLTVVPEQLEKCGGGG